jgi:hypothetical protein
MNDARPLAVQRRPRATLAVWTVAVTVVAGLTFWFVSTPPALTTSDTLLTGTTPVGRDLYLGVARAPDGRTLAVSGVLVHAAADVPVEVEPLLCVGGSPQVSSDPTTFCRELVSPDGRELGPGDTIVLRVRGEYAGDVSIDPVRIAYREGIRWGTQEAGVPAVVTILGR